MTYTNKLKKYNKNMDHSYTLGAAPTIELLINAPDKAMKILLSSKLKEDSNLQIIYDLCKEHNILIETNDRALNRLSPKENCYVIGVFEKYTEEISPDSSHVVLVNPSNMGNLGTIIRTCAGFGMNNIALISPCVDIFNPKVVRASMGAVFNINFTYYDSFLAYKKSCSSRSFYPFMLKGAIGLNQLDFSRDETFSIIFGNEATGLDDSFLNVGQSVVIEHGDSIDSLNLSVAVGICVHRFSAKLKAS